MAAVLRFLVWSKVVIVPKQAPILVCDGQAASLSSGCCPVSVHCQDHSLDKAPATHRDRRQDPL